MQVSCYSKCIANVKEEKLSVGEMSCVDRQTQKTLKLSLVEVREQVHGCPSKGAPLLSSLAMIAGGYRTADGHGRGGPFSSDLLDTVLRHSSLHLPPSKWLGPWRLAAKRKGLNGFEVFLS